MMNLAEIDNIEGKDGITKILDPFGGSGTTYFEGLKYGNNVQVTSNDITNIADLLCKDNVTFFRGL